MLRPALALALIPLAGCYNYDKYTEEITTLTCDRMEECTYLDLFDMTMDECLTWATPVQDTAGAALECEEFDKDAAQACIDATTAATCDDLANGTGLSICESVCANMAD